MPKQTKPKPRPLKVHGSKWRPKESPDPDPGAEVSQLKKQQNIVLKALAPSFRTAYTDHKIYAYYERAFSLWSLIFPDMEEEIQVLKEFLDDPNYGKYIVKRRHKFLRAKLSWASGIFPIGTEEDVSYTHGPAGKEVWAEEMNLGIQAILSTMPALSWTDETVQRIE